MDVIPFDMRGPCWDKRPLGTSLDTTVGTHGCLLVCAAMAGNALSGRDWTPGELNAVLTCAGGYHEDNLLIWAKAAEVYGLRLESLGECLLTPAPMEAINALLARGLPVMARVDRFDGIPGPKPEDEHWVVLVDEEWRYVDPRGGEVGQLPDPARKILAWGAFAKIDGGGVA
jgi:hypothetical protein